MTHVRHAAVAGMFYPGNPRELDATVRHYLAEAEAGAAGEGPTKAIIVPHAGYIYSGPVAASAYARLEPLAPVVRRVVLLGPCHRVAVRGLAVSGADGFATPLGQVPVDKAAVEAILSLPQVRLFDAAHAEEHSLEVQLPFLQEVLDDFALVPLVVGEASAEQVAEVLDRLWGGPETLIVVSSDLSHYLDYRTARSVDAATCRAIEALDPASIGYDQACGRVPVVGLLTVARRRGLAVVTLDLRNSGDTAGDRRRVVGYGAWAFTEPDQGKAGDAGGTDCGEASFTARTRSLLDRHGRSLLHLAAASIEHGLAYGARLPVAPAEHPPELAADGASFVTLTNGGRLRGCVGSPQAYRPLVEDVTGNAFDAAFSDGRFARLKATELPKLEVSISLLGRPSPIAFSDEPDLLAQLRPGVDGLIIQCDGRRALFLPQVWTELPKPTTFLRQLKTKAGLPADHWAADFKAWRFLAASASSRDLGDRETLWTRH